MRKCADDHVGQAPVVAVLDGARERMFCPGGRIAGVDEVGRGPLAGPVAAAAVILDPDHVPAGLRDSKELTGSERERLFLSIMATAHVGIAFSSSLEIDRINIRQATLSAMRRAVEALPVAPDHALIDGVDVPPELACPADPVIRGDAGFAAIAAASIVAKVIRDRTMRLIDRRYPEYGFCRNVGYGTREHLEALSLHGPCPFHRLSFAPLRRFAEDAATLNAN